MENGLLQEDSLVKTYPVQEKKPDLMEKGLVFGLKCGDLLGIYDQNFCLVKTLEPCLFEDSIEYLDRLPKSGMMRNGKIYELQTWVHRTEENEYGLLPTPRASDGSIAGRQKIQTTYSAAIKRYGKWGLRLSEVLAMTLGLMHQPQLSEWMMGFPIGWTDLNV